METSRITETSTSAIDEKVFVVAPQINASEEGSYFVIGSLPIKRLAIESLANRSLGSDT
jgi:hypothetical protein